MKGGRGVGVGQRSTIAVGGVFRFLERAWVKGYRLADSVGEVQPTTCGCGVRCSWLTGSFLPECSQASVRLACVSLSVEKEVAGEYGGGQCVSS